MATIRGGAVLPHVQALANDAARLFGLDSFGTYPGHEPTEDRAVDCFGSRSAMLALAQWCTRDDVIDHFGIDYVMFDVNQATVGAEIWNREISKSWRQVADRGGATQNHHDHVHISFNPTGSATPFGGTTTNAPTGGNPLAALTEDEQHELLTLARGLKAELDTLFPAIVDIQSRIGNVVQPDVEHLAHPDKP